MNKTILYLILVALLLLSGCAEQDDIAQKEEKELEEEKEQQGGGPIVGTHTGKEFNGTLQRFESFRVEAEVIDLYPLIVDATKEMGQIRIEKITAPCGSSKWKCKTELSEGYTLEVFFSEGTDVEDYCPPEGRGPCRLGYSVSIGERLEAGIQIDTDDSSFKRNTISVISELS